MTRLAAELEDHLGVRLVHRTTRRMTITPIGEEFLVQARQIVADVDDACAMADMAARETRGHLRVLAPPAIASHQLAKHLPARTRAFLEFLIQAFGGEDRDPWLAGTAAGH